MNKLKAVTDIYNDRQDEYWVYQIIPNCSNGVEICQGRPIQLEPLVFKKLPDRIGFYEWLFNKKYGVIHILHICCSGFHLEDPEEIIDSIYKQINSGGGE